MASLRKRGSTFYVSYYLAGREVRKSLDTDTLQLAKEKVRQFESAQLRGDDSPLPTRSSVAEIVEAYVSHIRTIKTAKSAQTDVYYLREAFGAICPGLQVTSRKLSIKARKRPLLPGAVQDLRRRPLVIEAPSFEQITTAQVSAFISGKVQSRGLAPKLPTGIEKSSAACSIGRWPSAVSGCPATRTPSPRSAATRSGRRRFDSSPWLRSTSSLRPLRRSSSCRQWSPC